MKYNINLEQYIKEYFLNNNIPLNLKSGLSTVKIAVYGSSLKNCSSSTVMRFTKKWFPNKPLYVRLFTYILELNNLKFCTDCKNILGYSSFGFNLNRKDCTNNICKSCANSRSCKYKKDNPNRTKFYSTKYNLAKLKRTPKWSNLEKIKEFYLNCPEGYHVDHIFPLRGKYNSGLHVFNNLQYLTSTDNLKKGNQLLLLTKEK